MLSWTTYEFEKKDRHNDWIWYAGLIFAIGAALAFFYGNIFFGIFLVIAGVLVIVFAIRDPKELSISFEEKGLAINNDYINYANIKQFWIDETGKPDKLLMLVKNSFVPVIVLKIEGVAAQSVREVLTKYTKEEFLRESTGVKIFERLGF